MTLRSKLCVVFLALAALASACLWDTDTLAQESKGKMDVLSIIVGRFERNPPLYYEMRLERVAKELERDPSLFNFYDDAGVASDRLGKHADAIGWMDKKKAAMDARNPTKDDRYRYHANLGTFYAHRWLSNKADFTKMEDLDKGIAHIRKAIEINPKAHFGREKYQLAILEWVKTKPMVQTEGFGIAQTPLGNYLASHDLLNQAQSQEAIRGLTGLIKLGNAWDSVDVFSALAEALAVNREGTTSETAMARVRELIAAGKTSISGWNPDPNMTLEGGAEPGVKKQALEEFTRLRKEADAWHEARTNYMLGRLGAGRHPDIHEDFWVGYEEKPIEVQDPPFWKKPDFKITAMMITGVALLVGVPTALIFIVIWLVKRARRKQAVP